MTSNKRGLSDSVPLAAVLQTRFKLIRGTDTSEIMRDVSRATPRLGTDEHIWCDTAQILL